MNSHISRTRGGHGARPKIKGALLTATAIVLWIRAEVPLTTVRMLAGHASLATTDRYARIARNDLAGAAAQVNSYMFVHAVGQHQRPNITERLLTRGFAVERTTGIEPAFSAWEADVLPLYDIRLTRSDGD